jgi:Fe-S cluster assembly iron-binding protein IscA
VPTITPAAHAVLRDLLAESPGARFRIQFTPSCGRQGLSISLAEIAFASDTSVVVDGIPLVYAKNLSHLVEDILIDVVDTEDGPELVVNGQNPYC